MKIKIYDFKICLLVMLSSISLFLIYLTGYLKTQKLYETSPEIYIIENEDNKQFEIKHLKKKTKKRLIVLTKKEQYERDQLLKKEKDLKLQSYLHNVFKPEMDSYNKRVYSAFDDKTYYKYFIDGNNITISDKNIKSNYRYTLGDKYDTYNTSNDQLYMRKCFIDFLENYEDDL